MVESVQSLVIELNRGPMETDTAQHWSKRDLNFLKMFLRGRIIIFSGSLSACSHSILPEYALPCVIHMLAHHPDFKRDHHETLVQFRE